MTSIKQQARKKDYFEAVEIANLKGLPVPIAAMEVNPNYVMDAEFWPEPMLIDDGETDYVKVDIVSHGGWLSDFAVSVAAQVQFPENTAFAHLLGVLSAATAKSFRYAYYGENGKAVNLYVVTAQPPSSGKSGIHETFTIPCQMAMKTLNETRAGQKYELDEKIKALEGMLKDGGDDHLLVELAEATAQADALHPITFAFDDVTPEAAEAAAGKQSGLINIASAEGDALNIILGSVYSGQSSKANHGMFLKAWDTEWHSPSRITRNTKEGLVYGSVAIIAQQEAIKSLLEAGQSGRGISERMLLMNERPMLGTRDFSSYTPMCKALREEYRQLVHNVILETELQTLSIDADSIKAIRKYRQVLEPKLADGNEYSNSMLRGAMGKADKQIIKIACLLHISEQWKGVHPKRTLVVKKNHVEAAIKIFDEFSKTYVQAADKLGFAGTESELKACVESLTSMIARRRYKTNPRGIRDSIKNKAAFQNVPNLTALIREKLIPMLSRANVINTSGDDVWINPKLKDY